MTRCAILGAVLVGVTQLAAARAGHAQGALAVLKPGERVRVWTAEPPLRGAELEVRAVEARMLLVATPRWADTVPGFRPAIPRESLIRLDVQRGRSASPRYRRTAVLGGFAIGLLGGITAGMIADSNPYSEGEGIMLLAPMGTLAGGIVGLLIGNHGQAVWQTLVP